MNNLNSIVDYLKVFNNIETYKKPEPRTMAHGGRIGFKNPGLVGKKTLKEFIDDKISKGEATFETKGDLIKEWGGEKGGNSYRTINEYEDKLTFKRKTRLGGNEALKNEKILEYFNNQEPGSKIKVERAVKDINKNLPKTEQISETIIYNRLKDTKFNTTFLGSHSVGSLHGQLSDAMKQNIIAKFGDELGITMKDFATKGKYGVNATTDVNKYESIRRHVLDKNTPWNKAYNVGAADGWILESMDRAGFEPIKDMIGGRERIIGYIDNDGTKWVGGKNWVFKHDAKRVTDSHPGWKRVNKLVNIVKETRVAPSQAITDLLAKSGVKNIDGLNLERLTMYLLDNDADIKNIKKGLSTFHKHHVKGVKGSYADDIQLVTKVANDEARRVVNEVEELKKNNRVHIDYDAIDKRLKNYGVAVEIDGKRLGGSGFESKADIEKWATKKIKELEKPQLEKLQRQILKKLGKKVTSKEAGFIATDLLKDFGKLGLKGGRLLKMLELQYEPLFEGLFYQYYKKYKGYDHGLAREELFLPKIIAKQAPKLWEKLGFKPFKTGVWEGADPLIEEQLREYGGGEYIDAQNAYQKEVDKYNKLDFDLKVMTSNKLRTPTPPEVIEAKKKEIEDQRELIIGLESTLKPGTNAYENYMRAQEKQDHEFGMGKIKSKAESAKRKEERRHKEYLEYRGGKERSFYLPKGKLKERVEDPLFQKPYTFLETDDTLKDIISPGKQTWEEYGLTDTQVGPVVREGVKDKWEQIYDMGGIDLMDRIGIAGGVANMAEGGIMSLKKK